MSKPKAINHKKLVAFVLPISRKSCLHASGQNGVQQFFYLQESRVRSTLGGVQRCNALRWVQGEVPCAGLRDGSPHRVKHEMLGRSRAAALPSDVMPCVTSYWVIL